MPAQQPYGSGTTVRHDQEPKGGSWLGVVSGNVMTASFPVPGGYEELEFVWDGDHVPPCWRCASPDFDLVDPLPGSNPPEYSIRQGSLETSHGKSTAVGG